MARVVGEIGFRSENPAMYHDPSRLRTGPTVGDPRRGDALDETPDYSQ